MGLAGAAGSPAGGGRAAFGTAGPAGAAGNVRARTEPIEVTAELTLEESFHGTTRIVEISGRRLELTIPRGAGSGNRIRLTGKGPDGRDLIVVTKQKPHQTFTRKGNDLERELPITLRE